MVFPQPVSPVTSTTLEDLLDSFSFDKKSSLAFHAGSDFLCLSIDLLQQNGVAGVVSLGGPDQNTLLVFGRFRIEMPLVLLFGATFVDIDVDGVVDEDEDDLESGFGTDGDDNGMREKSSIVCNMFCCSPYISKNIGSPNGSSDRNFAIPT